MLPLSPQSVIDDNQVEEEKMLIASKIYQNRFARVCIYTDTLQAVNKKELI